MVRIYHNPRCSKSRQALALLQGRGIEPEVVLYLQTPLDQTELAALVRKLGIRPRQLLRTGEAEYRELGLDDQTLEDHQILEAMIRCPKLMERPVVVNGDRAVVGRPPEAVLELI